MLQRVNTTQQSDHNADHEEVNEMISDSDSEELQPEAPQRSMSVPIQTNKPAFMKLSAGPAANANEEISAEKIDKQRRQSMEYADWIEGYRKWRLWNKKGLSE